MNKIVTLEQAMQYCGLAKDGVNEDDEGIFIRSLSVIIAGYGNPKEVPAVFKAFGDLPEDDPTQGVNAKEWDDVKDAVKEQVRFFLERRM